MSAELIAQTMANLIAGSRQVERLQAEKEDWIATVIEQANRRSPVTLPIDNPFGTRVMELWEQHGDTTAEELAMHVRLGRNAEDFEVAARIYGESLWAINPETVVVDITHIWSDSVVSQGDGAIVNMYEGCYAPPFTNAAFCYVTPWEEVFVQHMLIMSDDYTDFCIGEVRESLVEGEAADVRWDEVRWVGSITMWVTGADQYSTRSTLGPMGAVTFCLYGDGTLAHVRSVNFTEQYSDRETLTKAYTTFQSLDFLNCRNVEAVEPSRPRHERKRIARTGVTVHTINVFPPGRTTRSAKGVPVGGVPVHKVRGHFAHYGPEYGRGLLFGRIAGRFWIPQHVAGDRAQGEVEADYRLVPE